MTVIPAPPTRLSAETVELRPISDWDIPEILIAHQDDRQLARDLGLTKPPSGAQLGREVEDAGADWAAGTLKLTLLTPGSDDCRGRLTIDSLDFEQGSARATVWVAPEHRGQGLAGAALGLARDWLARSCGIEQLQCGEDRPRGG